MNRSKAPALNPIDSIDLIFPKRVDLGNGIDLFWMDDIPDETVKLDVIWDAGSKFQTKPLVASYTNQLLFSGNDQISSNQIAERIDVLGGYLNQSHHKDHASFSVFGLTDSMHAIFNLVQEYFQIATFPQAEIDKWTAIKQQEFQLNEEKVGVNARKMFTQQLFSENHPYGKLAKLADFTAVTQADLQSFFKAHYLGTKPTLFLVGNVSYQVIDQLKTFAQLFSDSTAPRQATTPTQTIGKQHQVKEKAVQSAIRVGKLTITKSHPDYIALQVLNTVLGGYFGSRLMANIREDKGYTYGIGSGLTALAEATYFFISTEVACDTREATLKEIYFEIDRLQTELIPKSELEVVKNYLLGSLLRNSDGAIAMMEKYKNIYLQNLSESYYTDYVQGINSITPKILKEVAQKHLATESMTEVSFG